MTGEDSEHNDVQREVVTLRQRVAELEQQVSHMGSLHEELQRNKNQARTAQEMLQLIIDNLPGSVFWKDTSLVYQGCNRSFAINAGVGEPQNIVGKTDYDLAWKREQADFFRTVDRRVMDANTPEYHISEPQQQADGKQAWLDTNKIPLHDDQGNVIGILGTFEDITERMQMEEDLRLSEDRFRTLVESIAVAAWIHQGGSFIYVNPATEALLGYTREELLGMKVWDIIHPDFVESVQQRAAARQRGEQPQSRYEIKVVTKSGQELWVDLNASRIEFEGQISILVTFLDITERKQLEETLRAGEERFRTLIETFTVGTLIHHQGNFRYANRAAETITGYSRDQLYRLRFADLIHPDFVELVQQRATARQRGEDVPMRYEVKIITGQGQERWIDLNNSRIDFGGEQCILVTALDITERKQMEETLRASEERFRTLLETITVGILIHQKGSFRYTNRAIEAITGYPRETLYQSRFADLVHPDFVELVQQRAAARQRGENVPARYEIKIITGQGQERWVDMNNNLIYFSGEPCILATILDITERKQMEETLRASEEQLRALVETNAVATWIHQGKNFLYVNPATEQLSGYTSQELQQMNIWELIHPDFRDMVRQRSIARQQGEQQEPRYEVKIVVKDGSERWVDLSARRIDMQGQPAIMATALDITARKEMEEDRARLHEETIQAQQAMLRELSTPLIPITDHVVVMPLVGRIDTWRAQQVLEGLLQGVAQHNASTAILDITGVPVVDTQVALALIQAAQAVRLLGAQVVLTGIRPDVAQSLVSLGVDLSDIVTLSSLQAGIAYATQQHRA